ncbi:MAG: ABC transporter permease [Pseudomonadota bacterium]
MASLAATPTRTRGLLQRIEASWPAMSAAVVAQSVWLGLWPDTWRGPTRDEFWRALEFATVGSVVPVLISASIVGVAVVAQVNVWLGGLGDLYDVREVLLQVVNRELAPLVVGLVMLGRVGLVEATELDAMRGDGTVRALEAQGVDTFRLLVLPRVLATGLACFAQAVLFVIGASFAGYVAAVLLDVSQLGPVDVLLEALQGLGKYGAVILPLKTMLMGFVLAAVLAVSALSPVGERRYVVPGAFFRGLVSLLLITASVSLLL